DQRPDIHLVWPGHTRTSVCYRRLAGKKSTLDKVTHRQDREEPEVGAMGFAALARGGHRKNRGESESGARGGSLIRVHFQPPSSCLHVSTQMLMARAILAKNLLNS